MITTMLACGDKSSGCQLFDYGSKNTTCSGHVHEMLVALKLMSTPAPNFLFSYTLW